MPNSFSFVFLKNPFSYTYARTCKCTSTVACHARTCKLCKVASKLLIERSPHMHRTSAHRAEVACFSPSTRSDTLFLSSHMQRPETPAETATITPHYTLSIRAPYYSYIPSKSQIDTPTPAPSHTVTLASHIHPRSRSHR